jgi:hypothetical protein
LPVPTKIPSTYRKTPLVKIQDPDLFDKSVAVSNSGYATFSDYSYASMGSLFSKYWYNIRLAARYLDLSSTNISEGIMYNRLNSVVASEFDPDSDISVNDIDLASTYFNKSLNFKNSLIRVVRELAKKDFLLTKQEVRSQITSQPLREELINIIEEQSISTSIQ